MKYESYIPEWKRLYEEKGCSFREISRQYGIDAKTVNRTLSGHVEKRPKSKWSAYGEEWLKLYESGYSKTQIAKTYHTTTSQVSKILSRHGVPIAESTQTHKYESLAPLFLQLYENGSSLGDISRQTGVAKQTIANYLEREGVERRSLSESIRQHTYNDQYFDTIDSYEKAYHLGLLFSEGSLLQQHNGYAIRFETSVKTRYLIEPLLHVLGYESASLYTADDDVCRVRLYSKHLHERLQELGFAFRKDARFPFLEERLYGAFLYGYFEGRLVRSSTRHSLYIGGNSSFLIRVRHILDKKAGIPKEAWKMENQSSFSRIHLHRKKEIEKLLTWVEQEAKTDTYAVCVVRPNGVRSPFAPIHS